MPSSRPSTTPTVPTIIRQLRAAGTAKKRASAIRVGIPMENAFGVSVGDVRALARTLKGNHHLAEPLWATAIHEARVLATILADPKAVRRADIERWLRDVVSWDLCDHLCGNLVRYREDAPALVQRWIKSAALYTRRAAFALIAELAVHDGALDQDTLDDFVGLIVEHSADQRPHVRQAASWALRSIGKRNAANHERALAAAVELSEATDPGKRWVGRDARRELESLIRVSARKRLLTSRSRTGRKELARAKRG